MSLYMLAFTAGLASFLSPCIILMITVYFSLITGMSYSELEASRSKKDRRVFILVNTLIFVAAFTLIFTLAGGAAGKISGTIVKNTRLFNIIGGIFVALLGLNLLGIIKLSFLKKLNIHKYIDGEKVRTPVQYLTTFIVGVIFAVVCSHCIGPILYSMLITAGSMGSAAGGMTLMFIFSMGLAIPYIIVGLFMNKAMGWLGKVSRVYGWLAKGLGVVLVLFGLLMAAQQFEKVTQIFFKLLPFKFGIGM